MATPKTENTKQQVGEGSKQADFQATASKFLGQRVACICARYQYRGNLSGVGTDHLVISDASSVEVSGPSNSPRPQTEDYIGSDVVIKFDAIEILYQPQWVFAAMPNK